MSSSVKFCKVLQAFVKFCKVPPKPVPGRGGREETIFFIFMSPLRIFFQVYKKIKIESESKFNFQATEQCELTEQCGFVKITAIIAFSRLGLHLL